jgi:hypothetical protein
MAVEIIQHEGTFSSAHEDHPMVYMNNKTQHHLEKRGEVEFV